MPLVQSDLERRIRAAMDSLTKIDKREPNPLLPSTRVASEYSTAYDSWVMTGFPTRPFSFVTPPARPVLQTALIIPTFLPGWVPGLSSYWGTATITGPGLIPINPIDPSSLAAALPTAVSGFAAMLVAQPASMDESAQKIASILFRFTTSLRFLTTTSTPPPVLAPFPVR